MTRSSRLLIACALVLFAGCLPGQIDDLVGQASTRVVKSSSVFEAPGFGAVLASTSGTDADGAPASRIVAGAGEDRPFAFFELETAGHFALHRELFHGCATPAAGCGAGAGASIAGLSSFRGESLCAAIGVPGSGSLNIACESGLGEVQPVGSSVGSELGRALVSLPSSISWGVAIASAPGSGALYALTSEGTLEPIALPADVGGASLGFGVALAASALPDSAATGLSNAVLLVVSQQLPARLHLLALGLDPDTSSPAAHPLGCVDGLASGVVVSTGDIEGDSTPEVFFSDASGPLFTHEVVHQLGLDALPRGGGCIDPGVSDDPVSQVISCPDIDARVQCASFGETLAIGDLNADGHADLLVGAPDSDVDGHRAAGAVYVFPGSVSGFDEVHTRVLADSGPGNDERLGSSLSTAPTRLATTPRDEPVVGSSANLSSGGSPSSRFLVFLCSGIPGDSADEVDLCLP